MSKWCNVCHRNEMIGQWESCGPDCPAFGLEYEELVKKYLKTIHQLKYLKDSVVENPCVKCSLNYDGSCCGCDKGREYKKRLEELK